MVNESFSRADFVDSRNNRTPEELYILLKRRLPTSGLFLPLPYHNADHSVEVADHCIRLVKRYNRYNPQARIDPFVAGLAGLLHDIHYGRPLHEHKSFEERSAQLAYSMLRTLGCSEDYSREIEDAILQTHADVIPYTLLGKILRAADLKSSASSQSRFDSNFYALMTETELQRSSPVSEHDFFKGSMRFFAKYLAVMIELTPEAFNEGGASAFHENILTFIISKFRRLFPNEPVSCSIGTSEQKGGLNIIISENSVDELARTPQEEGITFVIPLVGTRLPLPDKSCDIVIGEHPDKSRIRIAA
jgi:hypothetical protein